MFAVLAAGAMLGGTAVTPVLLASASAAELEPAVEGPWGEGAVGVLGGLTDAGHKAVDAVGAAGGAVTDVVAGPAPAPASAPVSEPPPRPAPSPAPVGVAVVSGKFRADMAGWVSDLGVCGRVMGFC